MKVCELEKLLVKENVCDVVYLQMAEKGLLQVGDHLKPASLRLSEPLSLPQQKGP